MRSFENGLGNIQIPVGHPESVQSQQDRRPIEQTQYDGLAVQHRDHGDTHVDFVVGHEDLNAAVLRNALFRDVELAEDLQTRDDGGLELLDLGGHRRLLKHAVDTIAHPQGILEGLDVHVGRPQFDGLGQDLIDEADDRRALGRIGQVHVVVRFRVDHLQAAFAGLGDHRLHRVGADAQILLDAPIDLDQRRQTDLEVLAGGQPQFVDGRRIERVTRHDEHPVTILLNRDHPLVQEDASGKLREEVPGEGTTFELDIRPIEPIAPETQHRLFGHAGCGEGPGGRLSCRE